MDVVSAVSGYISKMVSNGDVTGSASAKMKILLLDNETVRVLVVTRNWTMTDRGRSQLFQRP